MLQGEKIRLRPIQLKDLEVLNKWKNSEHVYRYLGGGFMPTSIDIQKNWMESLMDTTGSNKRFIIENISGHPIGMVGLYSINWIHRTCELGIFIGDSAEQGKGLGTEATILIEEFAKNYCNLRKIKLLVVEENVKAVRMYEKLNYYRTGKLIDERFIDGKYCSVLIMEKFLKDR